MRTPPPPFEGPPWLWIDWVTDGRGSTPFDARAGAVGTVQNSGRTMAMGGHSAAVVCRRHFATFQSAGLRRRTPSATRYEAHEPRLYCTGGSVLGRG